MDVDGFGYMCVIVEVLFEVMISGGFVYLVVDLVGDVSGLYFVCELGGMVVCGWFDIDVYVDNVVFVFV